ncbi:hypothetical protein BGZ72_003265, partial [Mortierella alpina]
MQQQLRAAVELLNLLQVYAYWACAVYITAILDGCSSIPGSSSPAPSASVPVSLVPSASSTSSASVSSATSASVASSASLSSAPAAPLAPPVAPWIPTNTADRQRLLDEVVDSKDFMHALANRLYYGNIEQAEEQEFSTPQKPS